MKDKTNISDQELADKLREMKDILKSTVILLQNQVYQTINLLDICIQKCDESRVPHNKEEIELLQQKHDNIKKQILKNHASFLKLCND